MESSLQRSLNIRISLQVSISALPEVVEEWMDTEIDRWLESVPLPPELPADHSANFVVTLGADASRVKWAAHGHPAGFVPKMAAYFDKCRIAKTDLALLDEIGQRLEPQEVGSWVAVHAGTVRTGWYFLDRHPFAAVEPLFGQHEARARLERWLAHTGAGEFRRFSQGMGDEPHTELEWVLPGADVDAQLAAAEAGFAELLGRDLPAYARQAAQAGPADLGLVVRIAGGQVVKCALRLPQPAEDVAATLAGAAGGAYSETVPRMLGALSAGGIEALELVRAGDLTLVDVDCVPASKSGASPRVDVN